MNVLEEVRRRHRASKARGGRGHRLKKPGKIQFPHLLERQYQNHLVAVSKKFSDFLWERMWKSIQFAYHVSRKQMPEGARLDDWPEDLEEAFDDAEGEWDEMFNDEQALQLAKTYADELQKFQKRQLIGSVQRMVGFDVFLDEPYLKGQMDSFAQENASLITSIPHDELADVKELVFRELRAGTRIEEIGDKIKGRFEVSQNKARFIGRDQTNKFNGQLNRLRQTNLGIQKYTWRGVMDDVERDSHRDHEGVVYRWDEPPANTGAPGEDYNCRCWAEPVIEMEEVEAEAA